MTIEKCTITVDLERSPSGECNIYYSCNIKKEYDPALLLLTGKVGDAIQQAVAEKLGEFLDDSDIH